MRFAKHDQRTSSPERASWLFSHQLPIFRMRRTYQVCLGEPSPSCEANCRIQAQFSAPSPTRRVERPACLARSFSRWRSAWVRTPRLRGRVAPPRRGSSSSHPPCWSATTPQAWSPPTWPAPTPSSPIPVRSSLSPQFSRPRLPDSSPAAGWVGLRPPIVGAFLRPVRMMMGVEKEQEECAVRACGCLDLAAGENPVRPCAGTGLRWKSLFEYGGTPTSGHGGLSHVLFSGLFVAVAAMPIAAATPVSRTRCHG